MYLPRSSFYSRLKTMAVIPFFGSIFNTRPSINLEYFSHFVVSVFYRQLPLPLLSTASCQLLQAFSIVCQFPVFLTDFFSQVSTLSQSGLCVGLVEDLMVVAVLVLRLQIQRYNKTLKNHCIWFSGRRLSVL